MRLGCAVPCPASPEAQAGTPWPHPASGSPARSPRRGPPPGLCACRGHGARHRLRTFPDPSLPEGRVGGSSPGRFSSTRTTAPQPPWRGFSPEVASSPRCAGDCRHGGCGCLGAALPRRLSTSPCEAEEVGSPTGLPDEGRHPRVADAVGSAVQVGPDLVLVLGDACHGCVQLVVGGHGQGSNGPFAVVSVGPPRHDLLPLDEDGATLLKPRLLRPAQRHVGRQSRRLCNRLRPRPGSRVRGPGGIAGTASSCSRRPPR